MLHDSDFEVCPPLVSERRVGEEHGRGLVVSRARPQHILVGGSELLPPHYLRRGEQLQQLPVKREIPARIIFVNSVERAREKETIRY